MALTLVTTEALALPANEHAAALRRQRILDVAQDQWGIYEAVNIPHGARVIENPDGSATVTVEINLPAFLLTNLDKR